MSELDDLKAKFKEFDVEIIAEYSELRGWIAQHAVKVGAIVAGFAWLLGRVHFPM